MGKARRQTALGFPQRRPSQNRDSHHYNGIFDAADPDSLAELLSKEPDLIVERRDGDI